MAYTVDELADLIALTEDDLGEGSWEDLASDLQRYYAMPQLLQEKKLVFGSGTGIEWSVMIDDNGAARNVGAFSVDNVNVNEYMQRPRVPWRHTETSWAWDVIEFKTNTGERQILDLVKTRRAAGMLSLAARMETDFWDTPTLADETIPYGIGYWVVYDDADDFVNLNPYGYSDCAGVSGVTYKNWSNWADKYTTVSEDDLFTKMRKGCDYTDFRPPIDIKSYSGGMDTAFYMVHTVKQTMEKQLRKQNDDIGYDLAWGDNQMIFRGAPCFWVPQLDGDPLVDHANAAVVDAVIQIDWSSFKMALLEDDYMEETPPRDVSGMHRVITQFCDTTWNTMCYNRRKQAIYSTTA